MAVRGRPPSGSWSGVVFTDVRDCLLKSVGVPVKFPVKDWFAPYNFTKKEVSSSRFILREQQPQNLFLLCRWVALRRESRECILCDTPRSPRSTVDEERERYEGVVSVPLSKGLFYEQMNEVATTGTPSYPSRSRLCLLNRRCIGV
jgi:hypothetical protein